VSKEPSRKKAKSTITAPKQLAEWLKKDSRNLNSKLKNSLKVPKTPHNLVGLELEEEEDLSDVRYQLKEIKSMMVQIEN
jgi:hypothetical protein